MTRFRHALLAALPLLLCLSGCSKGPQERLQGKWVGTSIDNIPPDQEARAAGWVKATSFEFKGSKVTVAVPAEEPRTGDYKISRVNGNRVTLQVLRTNGEADDTTLVLAGEKTLKWEIGNDRTITFQRSAVD